MLTNDNMCVAFVDLMAFEVIQVAGFCSCFLFPATISEDGTIYLAFDCQLPSGSEDLLPGIQYTCGN